MRQVYVLVAWLLASGLALAQPYAYSASALRCPCGNAPNWAIDSRVQGAYHFNARGFSPNINDDGSQDNDLFGGTGLRLTDVATADFCGSLDASALTLGCQSGTPSCTYTDFCFASASFTTGCDTKPTNRSMPGSWSRIVSSAFFSGFELAWKQAALGSGQFDFIVVNPGEGYVHHDGATTFSPGEWHNVIGRYTQGGGLGGTADLLVDGVVDATGVMASDMTSGCSGYLLNRNGPSGNFIGGLDNCWATQGALSDTDACRVAVCGMDGCACDCSGSTYLRAARHSSFGGPISCTLPACNKSTFD